MSGRGGGGTQASREDWVELVRAATDIVDYIGQSVRLRKVGRNWVGLCPFHAEKTPSFSVHAERQFYHCFSCKAGGDVFKFVQETEKVGFVEAVELLSRRAGIAIPPRFSAAPGESGRRARIVAALEDAAAACEQWLADEARGAQARAYLERRAITPETRRRFRLGLVPAGWENLCQRLARHGEDTLVEAGLAVRRGGEGGAAGARSGIYDRFRHRLMVPLVAAGGVVVGFGARALADEDQPKYLNSPETPVYHKSAFLFALDAARRHADAERELVVVEGYFDAIALHQAGIENAVATSGTALTAEQARLIRRVTPRVALTYDGDAAGQGAMMRSLGVLLAEGLEVAVVELEAGTDPDTLLRERGLDGWRAARARGYDAVTFIQRHLLRDGAPGDPRERALQAVVALAGQVGDEIRRRLLLERASRVFGLEEAVLERAAGLKRVGQRSGEPIAAALRAQRGLAQSLERQALQALLMAPAELEGARAEIGPADFDDPACAALAAHLWARGAAVAPAEEPAAGLERELLATAAESPGWALDARLKTLQLAMRRLSRELRQVQEQQSQAGAPAEAEALARRAEDLVSRRLVREEMCRRLQRQSIEERVESDPDHILSEIQHIQRRATGASND